MSNLRNLRRDITEMRSKLYAGSVACEMPDGQTATLPCGPTTLLKLTTYAMRLKHAEIECAEPPAPPSDRYQPSLELIRQAEQIRAPGGCNMTDLLSDLLV